MKKLADAIKTLSQTNPFHTIVTYSNIMTDFVEITDLFLNTWHIHNVYHTHAYTHTHIYIE